MKQSEMSFLEWTHRFTTQQACLAEIEHHRWPEGFLCPRCGHDKAYRLSQRTHKYQCAQCRYQISVTAGTVFHSTHLPLPKWFAAIYLMSADKGGISALRLSKLIGVSWPSAYQMLRLLRRAMADRDRSYWLSGLVEVDDALVGGRRAGKRGRGAAGKTPVLLAVENHGAHAGYLAAQVLPEGVNQNAVR
ncbi:MAG TPA: IS1595 family transposase, partial [Gammaproteobacteria bacterium]|nr:IS1595 family transposase [Gammaproteobacteria bacterium]